MGITFAKPLGLSSKYQQRDIPSLNYQARKQTNNVAENFHLVLLLCDGDQDEIERFAPLKRIDCSVTNSSSQLRDVWPSYQQLRVFGGSPFLDA